MEIVTLRERSGSERSKMGELRLAGCVILNSQGDLLLLHRNTGKRRQWEIPGGKIDPGEDAEKTATREVREELGVEVDIVRELGSRSFNEDTYTMIYTWFLAEIVDGVPSVQEPQTHDRCEYVGLDQLKGMADLSPNTRNFVAEVSGGNVSI